MIERALAPLSAWRQRRSAGRTVVLMYHEVLPDGDDADAWTIVRASDFERHMLHVREHFDVLSLEEALEAGPSTDGGRPRAVVTFDDGYAGVRRSVLPIVETLGIPITVFVATEAVETGEPYWYDRVIAACLQSREPTIDLRRYGLGVYSAGRSRTGQRRWARIQRLLTDLKACRQSDRDRAVAAVVDSAAAGGDPGLARAFTPLSRADLEMLARSPLVSFGAHTHGHEALETLEPARMTDTLRRCRDLLETWTGRTVRALAYPNGSYDSRVLEVVRELGFACAVSTLARPWVAGDSPFEIPRIGIGRYDSMGHLRIRLLGLRLRW